MTIDEFYNQIEGSSKDALIEEGITLDLLKRIDLSKKCSPVMPWKGGPLVDVQRTQGGKRFWVMYPEDGSRKCNGPALRSMNRVLMMRARYLIQKTNKTLYHDRRRE